MALPKIRASDLGEGLVLAEDDQAEEDKGKKRKIRQRKNRRWASRTEAMVYGRIGSSKLNELMQARKIVAKNSGVKVLVDLDSMDDYYDALPDVADTETTHTAA
jgi:hypothetical protein